LPARVLSLKSQDIYLYQVSCPSRKEKKKVRHFSISASIFLTIINSDERYQLEATILLLS
jgi:hypothetical protein